MTPEQADYIKKEFSELDDRELLRRVAFQEADYLPEALNIAREELDLRRIAPLDAREYFVKYPDEDPASGFCQNCLDQTVPGTPACFSICVLATRLGGHHDRCEACGSVVVTKWFCIGFLPVRRLESYRFLNKENPPVGADAYHILKKSDA